MDCHVVFSGQSVISPLLSPLRRLYFAQRHLRPHPSRVCVNPPGCRISSGPDGPTQGTFYTPLPSGERDIVTVSDASLKERWFVSPSGKLLSHCMCHTAEMSFLCHLFSLSLTNKGNAVI